MLAERFYYPDAVGGTVEAYEYAATGTGAVAPMFSDFAGETEISTLSLNASGRATVYVDRLVTFLVRNAAGVLVDSFTSCGRGEAVELQSTSLTGTLDDGTQGAGGVTYLDGALDLMATSFGARDFKVRVTGAASDQYLKDALVSTGTKPFFNVKDPVYGAVGDGAADDYGPIQAAITAASVSGGIVFFPAGDYLTSATLTITSSRVSLMGCGGRATRFTYNGTVFSYAAGVATQDWPFIRNIGFTNSSALYTISLASTPGITLDGLVATAGLLVTSTTKCIVRDCYSSYSTGVNIALGSGSDRSTVRGCTLVGSTGLVNITSSAYHHIDGNAFDTSASSSAGAVQVNSGSGFNRVTNNYFAHSSNNPSIGSSVDAPLIESGNIRNPDPANSGADSLVYWSAATNTSKFIRASRVGWTKTATNPGATYTPHSDYDTHIVSFNAALAVAAPFNTSVGNGHRLAFIFYNSTGAPLNITWNAVYNVSASPTTVNAGLRCRIEFIFDAVANVYRAITAANLFA